MGKKLGNSTKGYTLECKATITIRILLPNNTVKQRGNYSINAFFDTLFFTGTYHSKWIF